MRRRSIVALCVAVGAAIAAAITPGVVADPDSETVLAPVTTHVPPGYTIDSQVTAPDGSTMIQAHRGVHEVKPGEPGWVDPPANGEGQTP